MLRRRRVILSPSSSHLPIFVALFALPCRCLRVMWRFSSAPTHWLKLNSESWVATVDRQQQVTSKSPLTSSCGNSETRTPLPPQIISISVWRRSGVTAAWLGRLNVSLYDASFTSQTDYLQPKTPRANTWTCVTTQWLHFEHFAVQIQAAKNPVGFIRRDHNHAITKHGSPSVTHCPFKRWCDDSVCVQSRVTEANHGQGDPHGRPPGRSYQRTAKAVVVNVLDWFS